MTNESRSPRFLILIASIALAVAACARSSDAPRATPGPAAASVEPAALTCRPPLRLCTGCTGTPICALRCPECPPPEATRSEPVPATLALGPQVTSCGGAICAPGTFCCNPSCGICTPKGVNCTQQSCN
jgi:hypothetical protein